MEVFREKTNQGLIIPQHIQFPIKIQCSCIMTQTGFCVSQINRQFLYLIIIL